MNRYMAQRSSLKERYDAYDNALYNEVDSIFLSGSGTLLSTLRDRYHVCLEHEYVDGTAYRAIHLKR